MTRSTKIVAALGVAAGIGVAALPLGSFATLELVSSPQSKDVRVQLTVPKAVAIASDKDNSSNPCSAAMTVSGSSTTDIMPNSVATCENVVTAAANHAGAVLSVKTAGTGANATDLALAGGGDSLTASDAAVSAGSGTWNISAARTSGTGTIATAFSGQKGITTSDQPVYTTTAAEEANITMTYHFGTKPDQTVGTYSNVLTYTVTAAE